jgi:hypothetical protein
MARKFCPACNKLKAGSATECECGHVFDAASIVAVAAPKICPHCGAGNPQKAHTCHCGRHFDLDDHETRAVMVRRRNRGQWMFFTGLVTLGLDIASYVFGGPSTMWLILLPAFLISNGLRMVVGASRDLREHDAQPRLPQATVRRLD